jgi:hypothetical protein
MATSTLFRWLHRWRQRDDQHLVKRAALETADPIDELGRIVNEAQERDAEDERRLYSPMPVAVPSRSKRERLDPGSRF